MGVLARTGIHRHAAIQLDESFFAFPELVAFLYGLGGQRVIVLEEPSSRSSVRNDRLVDLLGSSNRTRTLVALSVLEQASLTDIATVAQIDHRSVAIACNRLDAIGITQSTKTEHERLVRLNDGLTTSPLIRRFLAKLAQAFPDIISVSRFVEQQRVNRNADLSLEPAIGWSADIVPIGDRAQASVLYELGHRGPMTTSGIARSAGISMNAARSAILSLEQFGLVAQRSYGKGHARKRWAALNPAHPIGRPLAAYATAISRMFPPRPCYRVPPDGFPTRRPLPQHRALPGPGLRTAILLRVFEVPGVDSRQLVAMVGEPDRKRLAKWLRHLQSRGLIDYGDRRGQLVATPNPRFGAHEALRTLVGAMARYLKPRTCQSDGASAIALRSSRVGRSATGQVEC